MAGSRMRVPPCWHACWKHAATCAQCYPLSDSCELPLMGAAKLMLDVCVAIGLFVTWRYACCGQCHAWSVEMSVCARSHRPATWGG